jgi:glycosyltransferase involved in cell wall biosynthesis
VVEGYRAAASRARLIFGNTTEMVNRFRELGAPDVRYLPNAAPTIRSIEPAREPYLVYVGRVHERFDAQLVTATADRLPGVPIVIAGTVEREPVGWSKLIARPNVRLEGLVPYERARELIGRSRGLLVPHRADDYTRSQDAMKAWDAMSVGAPVLSTSVPPSDRWREPLALLADEPAAFAAAAARLVAGELDHGREARLRLAAENGWSSRAESAIGAIREVSGWG